MSNVTETPVSPEEQAQTMMFQLRQMAQSIAGFTFIPVERRRRLIAVGAVPDAMFEVVAVACEASPRLASRNEITGQQIRLVPRFSRAFEAVAQEMELTARGIRDTVAVFKGDGGRVCLDVYNTAKRLNHPDERDLLIPHIRAMKQALGRRGKKPGDKAEPANGTPAPDAPATAPRPAEAVTAAKSAATATAVEPAQMVTACSACGAPKGVQP